MYYNLQMERKKAKLTQENMSALLGISFSTYHRKEQGQFPFRLEEAKKVQSIINAHRENKGQENLTLDELFINE